MTRRSEIAVVSNGLAKFELAEHDVQALSFAGRLLAVGWSDDRGSIGQYFAHLDWDSQEIASALAQVRGFVEHGVPDHVPLVDAFAPLLHLLANGRYRLEVCDAAELVCPGRHISSNIDYAADVARYASTAQRPTDRVFGFYPAAQNLMFIRASHELDPQTVRRWQSAIAAGKRPYLVTLGHEDGWYQYVIDGHHKAYSYGTLALAPHVLAIGATPSDALASRIDYHRALNLVERTVAISPAHGASALENFRVRIVRPLRYRLSFARFVAEAVYKSLWRQGWREGAVRFDSEQHALVVNHPSGFPTLVDSATPVVFEGELRCGWGDLTRMIESLARACREAWPRIDLDYNIEDPVTGEVAGSRAQT
jgi:hypothetical protein